MKRGSYIRTELWLFRANYPSKMTDFCIETLFNLPEKISSLVDGDQSFAFDEVLDFLKFDDESEECNSRSVDGTATTMDSKATGVDGTSSKKHIVSVSKRKKSEACFKVAFRTMSDVEIMDDGYRWRKYGKKSVKNSPNPRNYYRCSNADCDVKKRVERDRDDSRFVITTYNNKHNHESPFVLYRITPNMSHEL